MHRRIFVPMVGLAVALGVVTLALAGGAAQMPGPQAVALWNYIAKQKPYQKWNYFPDHKGMHPGKSPHGAFHKVFVNPVGLTAKKPPYPYGTIVVKDNYNQAKKLAAVTVMYKVKGFNPGAGDWFWAVYTPAGKVKAAGKIGSCIKCHAAEVKMDWIYTHEFK
jgi:hypothetical protein